MVTLIFLAKKLARAGKPCLVTLLPGGVAWSVTLTSALGLHKAKGWAPGSVAEGKPTWEQGKQGKSRVRFFQGVPDLVRGGSSGGPWPGSSEQVSKVSLEFVFPGGSRPRSRWGFRWSVAWPVPEVPVAGGRSPSLAPLPLGRPTRTSQRNPWPGPSRRSPSRGRIPRASPQADRGERANGLARLARSPRRGQVSNHQSPTRPSGGREARARVSRTCPVGDNAFWGTTLAGAKAFRPTLRLTIPDQKDLVPGLGIFFKTGPPARRANSRTLDGPGHGLSPRAPTGWRVEAVPGRRRAGWQVEASLDGGPRDPGRQAPRTPGGSGCVPLPWGPTTRPPSGRSGAK